MKLDEETLSPFVGGQMEIQLGNGAKVYRGEIKKIQVTQEQKAVEAMFTWVAQGESHPPLRQLRHWRRVPLIGWRADVLSLWANNIGPGGRVGNESGGDRFSINLHSSSQIAILIPPDSGSMLDPAEVEGL